uniref:DUF4794 domain-containing protein n=1 Tax=Glossina pallidipes TaxID=7398 RepID=A0A1A9ZS67_GLOPL
MCKINLVFIIYLLLGVSFLTEAGVLRNKKEEPQSTISPTRNATTTDFSIITTEKSLSRKNDEEAAILAAQDILFDSSPSELKTNTQTVQVEKSAKLLLLSPPKLSDKNKQPAEENVEEPEDDESPFESNTEIQMDITTVTNSAEATESANVKNKYEKSEISTEPIISVRKALKVHEKRDVSANHMKPKEKEHEQFELSIDHRIPKETEHEKRPIFTSHKKPKEKDQGYPPIYMQPKEEEHGKPPVYMKPKEEEHGKPPVYKKPKEEEHGKPPVHMKPKEEEEGKPPVYMKPEKEEHEKPPVYMKPKEEEHGKPPVNMKPKEKDEKEAESPRYHMKPEEKPEISNDHSKPKETEKENKDMPQEMKKPHRNNGKENMCPPTKTEEPKDMKHSFLHTAVLYEPEHSYVLVQPEPHLQSIFKGIEIIPTFVDHAVGINYVESW